MKIPNIGLPFEYGDTPEEMGDVVISFLLPLVGTLGVKNGLDPIEIAQIYTTRSKEVNEWLVEFVAEVSKHIPPKN